MDLSPTHYYKLNELLLIISGQWPFNGDTIYKKFIKVILYITVILTLLTQILYFIEINFEKKIVIQILPCFVASCCTLSVVIVFDVNICNFINLWNRMLDDWSSERVEEEIRIKEVFAEAGNFITKFFIIIFVIGILIFITGTSSAPKILDFIAPRNETHPIYLPFPALDAMRQHSVLTLIFQHTSITIIFTYAVTYQTLVVIHMIHIYGMFTEIGYRLQNLIPKSIRLSEDKCNINSFIYHSITLCIHRHQKAIEFASLLDSYYGPVFIIILIAGILMISPTFLQLSDPEVFNYMAIVQAILLIGFFGIINLLGQKLIDFSTEVSSKAYLGEWYRCTSDMQKLFIIIIRRGDKPCTVSAYNMYILSFDCFRMVMQAAFSYFMVLREVK